MAVLCIEDVIKALVSSEGKRVMQARQFFKDQKPWPDGVYEIKGCPCSNPDCECNADPAYLLDTPDGTVFIDEGDWIVKTVENENYYVRIQNEPVR